MYLKIADYKNIIKIKLTINNNIKLINKIFIISSLQHVKRVMVHVVK